MKKIIPKFLLFFALLTQSFANPVPNTDPFGLQTQGQNLALTDYALSDLKWVGTLDVEGDLGGLFQTPDGHVHRVTMGDFIGDEGRWVIRVDPQGIILDEGK